MNEKTLDLSRAVDIEDAYRAMAADQEREQEAEEWAEGIIGDIAHDEGGGRRAFPTTPTDSGESALVKNSMT